MINVEKVSEDIDYELIPSEGETDQQSWNIRILTGEFSGTVLQYGNLQLDGKNGCLRFNFKVISSPDPELSEANEDLQEFSGIVLEDVLENSIANGSFQMQDMKNKD